MPVGFACVTAGKTFEPKKVCLGDTFESSLEHDGHDDRNWEYEYH